MDRQYLEQKRDEYKRAWLEYMQLAAANEGAMQAIEDVLAHYEDTEAEGETYDLRGLVEGLEHGNKPD